MTASGGLIRDLLQVFFTVRQSGRFTAAGFNQPVRCYQIYLPKGDG